MILNISAFDFVEWKQVNLPAPSSYAEVSLSYYRYTAKVYQNFQRFFIVSRCIHLWTAANDVYRSILIKFWVRKSLMDRHDSLETC